MMSTKKFSELFGLLSWQHDSVNFQRYLRNLQVNDVRFECLKLASIALEEKSDFANVVKEKLVAMSNSQSEDFFGSPLVYRLHVDSRFRQTKVRFDQLVQFLFPDEQLVMNADPLILTDKFGQTNDANIDTTRVIDSFVVDFYSPWNQITEIDSGIQFSNEGILRPTADQMERIISKIEHAISIIKMNEFLYLTLQKFTKIIRIRLDSSDRFGSEQKQSELGTIRLHNPQSPSFSPLLLAEAIVHESIHSIVSTFECYIAPLASQYESDPKVRTCSPWSGNSIAHNAITHAICVYYGLWCFLESVEFGLEDTDMFESRVVHNSFGFRRGVSIESYFIGLGLTNKTASAMFSLMQKRVEARYGS